MGTMKCVGPVIEPDEPAIMALDRDSILGLDDVAVRELYVPEWGGVVYLRSLTGAERDAFQASVCDPKTGQVTRIQNVRARFAALVLGDEQGNRLFTDRDIPALSQRNAKALDSIMVEGLRFNAIDGGEVDDLEGN